MNAIFQVKEYSAVFTELPPIHHASGAEITDNTGNAITDNAGNAITSN